MSTRYEDITRETNNIAYEVYEEISELIAKRVKDNKVIVNGASEVGRQGQREQGQRLTLLELRKFLEGER